jgi:UrcA family protein
MKTLIPVALAAAALAALPPSPVSAERYEVAVSTAGLDVTTPDGRRALEKRAAEAGDSLCGYGRRFGYVDDAAIDDCQRAFARAFRSALAGRLAAPR